MGRPPVHMSPGVRALPILQIIQLRHREVRHAQEPPASERQSWSCPRPSGPCFDTGIAPLCLGAAPVPGHRFWTLQSTRHLPSLPHSLPNRPGRRGTHHGCSWPCLTGGKSRHREVRALAQGHPASERQPAWSPASFVQGLPVPIPRALLGMPEGLIGVPLTLYLFTW